MKNIIHIFTFWIIWGWKKLNGLKNYKYQTVKRFSPEIKAEHVRMWMATDLPDDDFF